MIPVFLVLAFTLIFQSVLAAVPVVFEISHIYLLLAPVIVVVSLVCLETFEAMWAIIAAGIILDILTANSSGIGLLAITLVGASASIALSYLGKPHWPMLFGLLFAASLLERLILSYHGQVSWDAFLIGPLMDCFFGALVFYFLPRSVIKID